MKCAEAQGKSNYSNTFACVAKVNNLDGRINFYSTKVARHVSIVFHHCDCSHIPLRKHDESSKSNAAADLPESGVQRARCASIATAQHSRSTRQTCDCLVAMQISVRLKELLPQYGARASVRRLVVVTLVVLLHFGVKGCKCLGKELPCDIGGNWLFLDSCNKRLKFCGNASADCISTTMRNMLTPGPLQRQRLRYAGHRTVQRSQAQQRWQRRGHPPRNDMSKELAYFAGGARGLASDAVGAKTSETRAAAVEAVVELNDDNGVVLVLDSSDDGTRRRRCERLLRAFKRLKRLHSLLESPVILRDDERPTEARVLQHAKRLKSKG